MAALLKTGGPFWGIEYMDIKKTFGTNRDLELEGVWEPINEEASVKIARIGNDRYTKLFQKLMRPYRKQVRRGTMPDKKAEEIYNQVIAETVLLDWKGLTEDDKPLEYSVENAIRLLTEYKDFKDLVVDAAEAMETFQKEEIEESEKN